MRHLLNNNAQINIIYIYNITRKDYNTTHTKKQHTNEEKSNIIQLK